MTTQISLYDYIRNLAADQGGMDPHARPIVSDRELDIIIWRFTASDGQINVLDAAIEYCRFAKYKAVQEVPERAQAYQMRIDHLSNIRMGADALTYVVNGQGGITITGGGLNIANPVAGLPVVLDATTETFVTEQLTKVGIADGEITHDKLASDAVEADNMAPGAAAGNLAEDTGNRRVDAQHIQNIATEIDRELGSNAWRTGGGGTSVGLTASQVDARIAAEVQDWAETANTDLIPAGKLGNAPGLDQQAVDARVNAVIPANRRMLGGGTADQKLAKKSDGAYDVEWRDDPQAETWAQVGNNDAIPADKLANAPQSQAGLNQQAVDGRVRAGVADWAQHGNTDNIPRSKLTNAPTYTLPSKLRDFDADLTGDGYSTVPNSIDTTYLGDKPTLSIAEDAVRNYGNANSLGPRYQNRYPIIQLAQGKSLTNVEAIVGRTDYSEIFARYPASNWERLGSSGGYDRYTVQVADKPADDSILVRELDPLGIDTDKVKIDLTGSLVTGPPLLLHNGEIEGVAVVNSNQGVRAQTSIAANRDFIDLDLSQYPNHLIAYDVLVTLTGRSDNGLGFEQNYNSATNPQARVSGIVAVKRLLDAGARDSGNPQNHEVVGKLPVNIRVDRQGDVEVIAARGADNHGYLALQWANEAGSFSFNAGGQAVIRLI